MQAVRLFFVTGKGGVGKTTVAAALGQYAAETGHRTLIIETAADGRLAHLFGHRVLDGTPRRLRSGLDAVRVDGRQLLEEYFSRLLRFRLLSERLLSSQTFGALTAAAPGITEFLLLERVLGWIEPGFGKRHRAYEVVIVDGPSTGHALKLLHTPRTLATMVPGGPLGKAARRLLALLGNHKRTQVVLVSLPDEMSVRETIETHDVLEDDLALQVTRPVMNRVAPRHFSPAEAHRIEQCAAADGAAGTPLIRAARFNIASRRETERHIAHLRRGLGLNPILLQQLFVARIHAGDLEMFGRMLGKAVMEEMEASQLTADRTPGVKREPAEAEV